MVSRGKLKVFLGAAPGVGKTYAMLEEGHRLRAEGRDVAIGFVEPHGRAETAAIVGDLEIVPRRSMPYRGTSFDEMDLDAVLARRPDVALVDELAHTNVPGSRHAKRWQDVDELLDAGVDVLSTVNIQHLESLNDVIFEITDVVQRETIPDEVVRKAEEIELVDLTQEGVRERLAAGKIYPAERIDAALANYFRPGNLGALRELALSWTADRVDEAVATYRDLHGIDQPWETKERVVVALAGAEGSEDVVRRAARLAMRSRADLVGVYVRPTDGLAEESSAELANLIDLLQQLGGRYHELVGDDIGTALVAFAREENATQIVLGASRRSRLDEFRRGSPIAKVIRNAGDIDVHVISYEGARKPRPGRRRHRSEPIGGVRRMVAWGMVFIGLPTLTAILIPLRDDLALHNVLLIYLLAAVVIGGVGGALPAGVAAVAGFLLANWFFTLPLGTWTIGNRNDLFSLFAFLLISLAVGLLVGYSSRRSAEARKAHAQAEALAQTTGWGLRVAAPDQQAMLRAVRDILSLDAVSLIRQTDEGWETLLWDGTQELRNPADGTETIDLTPDAALVIAGGKLTIDDRTVLRAFAAQIVQAMQRSELEREAGSAEAMAETDRLRTALLGAVSHDLRTPLATIKASLTSLVETGVDWSPEQERVFLNTALEETERLNRLVGRLLDASRVQAGAVHVFFRPVDLDAVVAAALSGLSGEEGRVVVDIAETLPDVQTDPDLLERVVANLVENALAWSPLDQTVRISAGEVAGRIDLRISDRGPGIPEDARDAVFLPFQRFGDSPDRSGVGLGLAVARGLLEAMGNDLLIEDTPGGGTTMVVGLKIGSSQQAAPVLETRARG
jgi:two-component system, OmpR family, sensor histidine kinase KdpD